jgi:HK97 family phage major capsid protein
MPKACELRSERAKIHDEARLLGEKAAAEKREFTADERVAMDAHLKKLDELAADISRLDRLDSHAKITTPEQFERELKRVSEPLPCDLPANKGKYSLCRAITRAADKRLDGLEGETHQEISRRIGKSSAGPLGFFMPTSARMAWDTHPNFRVGGQRLVSSNVERRIDDTTAGAGAVLTRWDTTWIEYLRARMVLNQLGIKTLTDMHGNFQLPSQTGIGTVSWVAESTGVSATAQTIGQVLFQPKTVGAYTDMSRRFLEQLSIDAELFVREDLAAILARGIETAVYNGTGSPQPTGILQNGSITQVVSNGTNGGYPTYSDFVQLEELLGKANADLGNLAYVCTPGVKGSLKQIPVQGQGQTSYYPIFIWQNGQVNEYPIYSTNLLPSNLTKGSGTNLSATIFANWSDAVLAFWSGMDVLVDPYTGGAAGTIRIVVLQDCDFEVRHTASFAYMNDVQTY